jgi:hypothetical protein
MASAAVAVRGTSPCDRLRVRGGGSVLGGALRRSSLRYALLAYIATLGMLVGDLLYAFLHFFSVLTSSRTASSKASRAGGGSRLIVPSKDSLDEGAGWVGRGCSRDPSLIA